MIPPALFFYLLLSPLLFRAASGLSLLNPRLRTFFRVRKSVFTELAERVASLPPGAFRLWVHAASVGEFEQARPVIAELKKHHPDIAVFVSFLSDSGYNARKNFPDAAAVFYLPTDTRANAKRLMKLLQPDLLLLMRYDFWPNHLLEAKKAGTKLILAAAVLQPHSQYFKPMLQGFYRALFHLFDAIFTVSASDTTAFRETFQCSAAETAGDPRFDQVRMRSRDTAKVAHLKPLFEHCNVLVAGSVWEKDEALLLDAWQSLDERPSLILVPHEVNPENMERLYGNLQNRSLDYQPVSALNASFDPRRQLLVIDQTGYLAELYALASFAYVGGGFGVNVHNTLEPAVYGIPVLFGPRIHNSPEAEALVASGGGTVVRDQPELAALLKVYTLDALKRTTVGRIAGAFVQERTGATAIITASVERFYEVQTTGRGKKTPEKR